MIVWGLYFILSMFFMVLCYITNPIAMLFADINGELPYFWKYWQTWDNSTACRESVENAPKFLQYEWARHYREYKGTDPYLASVNRDRWFVSCIDPNFTLWERVQRYCCGVLWLTRNCSYGFSFYMLGLTVSPTLEIKESENTKFVREVYGQGLWGAWEYKNTAPIFKAFGYIVHWNNLLGWKIDESAQYDTRAMIANRIAFYFEKEKEC